MIALSARLAAGQDFLRALEAVTQDNTPAETGQGNADDIANVERPQAVLIVVGHRCKARMR